MWKRKRENSTASASTSLVCGKRSDTLLHIGRHPTVIRVKMSALRVATTVVTCIMIAAESRRRSVNGIKPSAVVDFLFVVCS